LFIYLFLSWFQSLLVVGYDPSRYVTIRVLFVAPAFQDYSDYYFFRRLLTTFPTYRTLGHWPSALQ